MKLSKKQKLVGGIAIIIVAVILAIVITTSIVKNNNKVASEGYSATTANAGSSLVASYIKKEITIGGITGTLETLIQNAGTLTIIDSHDRQSGRISNTSGIAINNTGTFTLGTDDGTVSTTCPEISGNSTGVVNNGTFNFYDGIIKGAEALSGTVTSRPDGYVINSSTDEATGMKQLTLGR